MSAIIRIGTITDLPQVLHLINELAIYEKAHKRLKYL